MSEQTNVPKKRNPDQVLKVSASANTQQLASAVAHSLYESGQVTVRAVGAGAVNQAVKAIAVARGFVAPRGMDLYCVPGFQTVDAKDGKGTITTITFKVVTF